MEGADGEESHQQSYNDTDQTMQSYNDTDQTMQDSDDDFDVLEGLTDDSGKSLTPACAASVADNVAIQEAHAAVAGLRKKYIAFSRPIHGPVRFHADVTSEINRVRSKCLQEYETMIAFEDFVVELARHYKISLESMQDRLKHNRYRHGHTRRPLTVIQQFDYRTPSQAPAQAKESQNITVLSPPSSSQPKSRSPIISAPVNLDHTDTHTDSSLSADYHFEVHDDVLQPSSTPNARSSEPVYITLDDEDDDLNSSFSSLSDLSSDSDDDEEAAPAASKSLKGEAKRETNDAPPPSQARDNASFASRKYSTSTEGIPTAAAMLKRRKAGYQHLNDCRPFNFNEMTLAKTYVNMVAMSRCASQEDFIRFMTSLVKCSCPRDILRIEKDLFDKVNKDHFRDIREAKKETVDVITID